MTATASVIANGTMSARTAQTVQSLRVSILIALAPMILLTFSPEEREPEELPPAHDDLDTAE